VSASYICVTCHTFFSLWLQLDLAKSSEVNFHLQGLGAQRIMQHCPVLLRVEEGEHVEADDTMSQLQFSARCEALHSQDPASEPDGTDLEPSSFVSVAKYSKILSGPLRSLIRFSYLKNVRCLVDNGRICQDCSTGQHMMQKKACRYDYNINELCWVNTPWLLDV
jgi:hypothetical protein